jgi:hypothetical protein
VAEGKEVALVLVGFAFIAQIVAAIFCFLARDGTAATATTVLSLTWLVAGVVLHTSKPGATSGVLGLFLLASGAAMALTSVTAALSKLVPAAVFGLAALRFFTTAGYELSDRRVWEQTAGVLGPAAVRAGALRRLGRWAGGCAGPHCAPAGPPGERQDRRARQPAGAVEDVSTRPGVREQL